jgi:hypothetical protein
MAGVNVGGLLGLIIVVVFVMLMWGRSGRR